jgi:hypothetical protein
MKQVIVTFNFDPETELVSDLKCSIDGVEKKKTTTKSKKTSVTKEQVMEEEALITLEKNKLVFNNKALADMNFNPEDRVLIIYEQIKGTNKRFPIIGSDLAFDQESSGNKLTKAGSIAYRGNANTILSEWGSVFGIEPFKDGIWKLVSKDVVQEEQSYEDILEEVEKQDFSMFTDEEEEFEIEELPFKL